MASSSAGQRCNVFCIVSIIFAIACALLYYYENKLQNISNISNVITLVMCAFVFVYSSIVYKRIGKADKSTEMSSLLKKVEVGVGATGSVILAIIFIAFALAFLIYGIILIKENQDYHFAIIYSPIIIVFGVLAWLLIKNRNQKKSKFGLLVEQLQALEEDK